MTYGEFYEIYSDLNVPSAAQVKEGLYYSHPVFVALSQEAQIKVGALLAIVKQMVLGRTGEFKEDCITWQSLVLATICHGIVVDRNKPSLPSPDTVIPRDEEMCLLGADIIRIPSTKNEPSMNLN